jgi:hypothetical protein
MTDQDLPGSLPPPPPAPAGNPWEERRRLGPVQAFLETFQLFVVAPQEGFRRTPERRGDLLGPLLFALVTYWLALVAQWAVGLLVGAPFEFLFPREPEEVALGMAANLVVMVFLVVLSPVFIVLGTFLHSAILHLCLWLVGGLGGSRAGFEGTFRVVCYSSVSQSASVIPFIGPLIALIWGIFLQTLGLAHFHRTSQARAVAAVLLPIFLCCALAAFFALAAGVATLGQILSGGGG